MLGTEQYELQSKTTIEEKRKQKSEQELIQFVVTVSL
jgi:hypothetical protein